MLKQLWMTGILAAFSVFGIKIGLGLGAHLGNNTIAKYKKRGFITGCFFIYLILFFGMYYLITGLNLLNYLDQLAGLLKYGMILHFAIALGLFVWGAQLIVRLPDKKQHFPLKASLLLIIPCPICATVILLNLALSYSLFPMVPSVTTAVLFGLFSGIIIITSAIIFWFNHRIKSTYTFLGLSMVMVSLYFLLTLIVAPVYPEIKAAFAMAVSNNPSQQINPVPFAILSVTGLVLGSAGFLKVYFAFGGNK